MKKMLSMLLALMLAAVPALAADSGFRFEADTLGIRMVIDEDWMDAVDEGRLQFFLREDEDAQKDGVRGYGLIYEAGDLDNYMSETYEEAENWLNENCTLVGGVVAHEEGAQGLGALYPEFERTSAGQSGALTFTLIRPAAAPEGEIAGGVWAALTDEGRFKFFDPDLDYGLLGAFETADLAGNAISNEYMSGAKLTLVNFWATYCPSCLKGMPTLGAMAEKYADKGVRFLGIVTDAYDADTIELARQIAQSTGARYPHIRPVISQDVLSRIQFIPMTVFLDSDGRKVGETVSGALDEAGWIEAIESRLAMVE